MIHEESSLIMTRRRHHHQEERESSLLMFPMGRVPSSRLHHRTSGVTARPKSRAIAIVPSSSRPHAIVENEPSDVTYDWATWKMYNRIVDFRSKQPISIIDNAALPPVASSEEEDGSANLSDHFGSSSYYATTSRSERGITSASTSPLDLEYCDSDLLLDGEVFDLEM